MSSQAPAPGIGGEPEAPEGPGGSGPSGPGGSGPGGGVLNGSGGSGPGEAKVTKVFDVFLIKFFQKVQ